MTPFRCVETEIIERGLKTPTGYQVRNIPLFLKDISEDEAEKEIVINFDNTGMINGIYFSLGINNYISIMKNESDEITDARCRTAILNFLEKYYTAYYQKNIDLIAKLYGDDALIITEKVIKQKKRNNDILENHDISQGKNKYQVQTNKEYIDKLHDIFKKNPIINVKFDSIGVVRHPKLPDIYGLTFKQSLNTTNYSNVGYCFFLLDFRDFKNMQIYIQTWQPEKINGQQLSEDEIYKLGDFNIKE
jgi:hypothetical protein